MKKHIFILPIVALSLVGCDNNEPDPNEKTAWTSAEITLLEEHHGYVVPFLDGATITLESNDTLLIKSKQDADSLALIDFSNKLTSATHGYIKVSNSSFELDLEKTLTNSIARIYGGFVGENIELRAVNTPKTIDPDPDPDPDPNKVILTPNVTYLKMRYQETFQLEVGIQPLAAQSAGVTYSVTSQENYISVSPTGLITIYDCGTATFDRPHAGNVRIISKHDDSVSVDVKIDYYNGYNRTPPTVPAVAKTFSEVYSDIAALKKDKKGTVFSNEYVKVKGVYLHHVDDDVPVITDGVNILQTHLEGDLTANDITEGSTYEFSGYVSSYIHKPGFSIIAISKTDPLPGYTQGDEFVNANTYTATQIRSYSVDSSGIFPVFQKMVTFEGYLVTNPSKYIYGLHDTGKYSIPTSDGSTVTKDLRFSVEFNPTYAQLDYLDSICSDSTSQTKIRINFFITHYGTEVHTWRIFPYFDTIVEL